MCVSLQVTTPSAPWACSSAWGSRCCSCPSWATAWPSGTSVGTAGRVSERWTLSPRLSPVPPLLWHLARPGGAANSSARSHAKIFPVVAAVVEDLRCRGEGGGRVGPLLREWRLFSSPSKQSASSSFRAHRSPPPRPVWASRLRAMG